MSITLFGTFLYPHSARLQLGTSPAPAQKWTRLPLRLKATTSCKNVETLSRKNNLSCFKSLLVTGPWDIILTSLLPPIQSCSSKFWTWSCIASNFDRGWRGDHKHKIMDKSFMPKYGTEFQRFFKFVQNFDVLPENSTPGISTHNWPIKPVEIIALEF